MRVVAGLCVCVIVLTFCNDVLAEPSLASTLQAADLAKTLFKRDYAAADPAPADPVPANDVDNGFYYYYYPVEDEGKKGDLGYKDSKDYGKCAGEKLLAPLIIISVFLGIIALRDIGLVPTFELPPISIPEIALPTKARDLASSATDYIPWSYINNLTVAVTEAVESEECMQRLVCHSGRYAEGRTVALSILEFFTPESYQPHVRIFKDSALKNTDCSVFRCSYAEYSNTE